MHVIEYGWTLERLNVFLSCQTNVMYWRYTDALRCGLSIAIHWVLNQKYFARFLKQGSVSGTHRTCSTDHVLVQKWANCKIAFHPAFLWEKYVRILQFYWNCSCTLGTTFKLVSSCLDGYPGVAGVCGSRITAIKRTTTRKRREMGDLSGML